MVLNELLLAERIARVSSVDGVRAAMEEEARAMARDVAARRGVRGLVARSLVRLGTWIDPQTTAREAPALEHSWY